MQTTKVKVKEIYSGIVTHFKDWEPGDIGIITVQQFQSQHINERVLREIYQRNFQIPIEFGDSYAIMTSYNLINGIHTINHKPILDKILHNEW